MSATECFVLCVDDDADFVKSLELFLPERVRETCGEGPDYQFLFFTDPQDALESLDELLSDQGVLTMVISDQQMPQMRGTAFLARIRERCPDCVRVLLTGHAGLDSAIAAINERLLDKYLTKPVENEHDFTLSITHLLQSFWMHRTIQTQQRTIGDLYRFSDTLNALTTLPATLEHVTRFAREAFGCRHASAWLLEGCDLTRRSDPEEGVEPPRVTLTGEDLEGLHETRVARILSPAEEEWWKGARGEERGELPFLRATLVSGSEVLGVLVVGDRDRAFDEGDREILAYVADTASIAIYNRIQSAELDRAYRASSAQAVEVALANERLRSLDRLKDDFLTFVSHELRTPLTVLSAVEFLDPGERADQKEIVGMLRSGYERLKRFIETALAYRTWIVGEPSRADELVPVAELLRTCVAATPGLSGPRARVTTRIPDDPCLVRGGTAELGEVFRILLDNAVRFSREELRVRIDCDVAPEEIRIVIEDRGAGFHPELAEEILKPFTIADSLHHQSGSALNLAKANAIVIAHGGKLRAESQGEGTGARFTVTLPRPQGLDPSDLLPRKGAA